MLGTIVNALLIISGSVLGLFLKKGVPEHYQTTIMQGVAIVVAVIGMQMALKSTNVLIVIASIALGALLGEVLKLDEKLNFLGNKLADVVKKTPFLANVEGTNLSQGFVTATLVYCIGAMSVVGSVQEGLLGDASILYAKGLIDGITAIFFTSSLGIGVAFSAISVILYQGSITYLAGYAAAFLSDAVINEMTATGGVLILGIALVMLKVCEIKLANFLPAIVIAIVITSIYTNFF